MARPHPRLRRAIHLYRGFRKDLGRPRRWLGLPASVVTLVLGFDTGHLSLHRPTASVTETRFSSSLITGLTTASWICDDSGSGHCVEVVLAPWAAFALFGVEMHELADKFVEPDEILGQRAHGLTDALADLPDWKQRFELLDAALTLWVGDGFAWSPRVASAYEALRRSRGTLPIRKVAEGLGWHRRQLEYRFREQIGLPPKAVARVFRFRHAVRLLTQGQASVATAEICGFSDQAHLTREFKAFIGVTPGRFRASARSGADTLATAVQEHDVRAFPLAKHG